MRIERIALLERLYHDLCRYWRIWALTLCLIVAASIAAAHSWYDPECCSDQDCAPIPASAVERLDDGTYRVTLWPGQHPMVEGRGFIAKARTVRTSRDGEFHACVFPHEGGEMGLICL